MWAFYLGLVTGALGGLMFLTIISMLDRKDDLREVVVRTEGYGEPPNQTIN